MIPQHASYTQTSKGFFDICFILFVASSRIQAVSSCSLNKGGYELKMYSDHWWTLQVLVPSTPLTEMRWQTLWEEVTVNTYYLLQRNNMLKAIYFFQHYVPFSKIVCLKQSFFPSNLFHKLSSINNCCFFLSLKPFVSLGSYSIAFKRGQPAIAIWFMAMSCDRIRNLKWCQVSHWVYKISQTKISGKCLHAQSRMGEGSYFPLCILLLYIKKNWYADSVEKNIYIFIVVFLIKSTSFLFYFYLFN